MNAHRGKKIAVVLAFFLFGAPVVHAQIGGYGIPSTYIVSDTEVESGDIISFNPREDLYVRSLVPRDEDMFGIVDVRPLLVFRNKEGVPIVQVGETLVNVTTINGSIEAGDSVTTSEIPGKGQRFERGGEGYILGYALEGFDDTKSTSTIIVGTEEIYVGTIRVLLSIGPAYGESNSDPLSTATIFVREQGETETGLETIFRYITAALFALGTIFVVLKTFGPNIGRGVVSIGRNPLAKTSIQAMMVFNMILILSISTVAFIVSLLIIFLPV